ncbi:unnamed protein product [Blepharisma stoltei]|uniref:Uncharacterized protein n=1 Tax=Blepharisma stoltei TaxID=1481888 RepID=A0AAU9J443_9CILI|nr:unnamed protein product [Blepharisma stoltei]
MHTEHFLPSLASQEVQRLLQLLYSRLKSSEYNQYCKHTGHPILMHLPCKLYKLQQMCIKSMKSTLSVFSARWIIAIIEWACAIISFALSTHLVHFVAVEQDKHWLVHDLQVSVSK